MGQSWVKNSTTWTEIPARIGFGAVAEGNREGKGRFLRAWVEPGLHCHTEGFALFIVLVESGPVLLGVHAVGELGSWISGEAAYQIS